MVPALYMYYATPQDAALLEKELRDQRCRGMTAGIFSPPVTRACLLTPAGDL